MRHLRYRKGKKRNCRLSKHEFSADGNRDAGHILLFFLRVAFGVGQDAHRSVFCLLASAVLGYAK